MGRGYPRDWNKRRKRVYRRDNYQCQKCGRYGGPRGNVELHAHHIRPKSKGGSHHPSNLLTVCKRCHERIHGHSIGGAKRRRKASRTRTKEKARETHRSTRNQSSTSRRKRTSMPGFTAFLIWFFVYFGGSLLLLPAGVPASKIWVGISIFVGISAYIYLANVSPHTIGALVGLSILVVLISEFSLIGGLLIFSLLALLLTILGIITQETDESEG